MESHPPAILLALRWYLPYLGWTRSVLVRINDVTVRLLLAFYCTELPQILCFIPLLPSSY